jgi:DNA-binding IclR family transcriptional regulator
MVASDAVSADRVARLFDVLELLVGHQEGLTVSEISKRLNVPISSAHNLLQRLVAADVVVASEGPRYSVGTRLVRLGIRTVDGLEVASVARKHLRDLARTVGDDVYLAVRLGTRVVYVERFPGNRPVTVDIRLGQALFLHATSVGKLFSAYYPQLEKKMLSDARPQLTDHTLTRPEELKAELAQIVRQGYASSREEAIVGVVGLAVPIMNSDDELAAAIHISALRAQMDNERLNSTVDVARTTARSVEKELGR